MVRPALPFRIPELTRSPIRDTIDSNRIVAGGLAGLKALRVEKAKPDPLNLSVNTGAGKQFIQHGNEECFLKEKHSLFIVKLNMRGDSRAERP